MYCQIALLREIFDLPGLKLNLKFEIEVLFNTLSIKMGEIKPTVLLKDRQPVIDQKQDFTGSGISPLFNFGTQSPQPTNTTLIGFYYFFFFFFFVKVF